MTEHPLQPFDPRNLGAAPDGAAALLPTIDPSSRPGALVGARSALGVRQDRVLLGGQQLAAADRAVVDLADLCRFFDNPAKAFLRDRLAADLAVRPRPQGRGDPDRTRQPGLWGSPTGSLTAVLDGRDPMMVIDAELWRGELPRACSDSACSKACSQRCSRWPTASGRSRAPRRVRRLDRASIDIDIDLPSGRRLAGTIGDLVGGHAVAFSALLRTRGQAPDPVVDPVPRTVGGWPRPGDQSRHRAAVNGHRRPARAQRRPEVLDRLIDLRDRGLREVVPLPPKTSLTWAQTWLRGIPNEPKADAAADKEWVGETSPVSATTPVGGTCSATGHHCPT